MFPSRKPSGDGVITRRSRRKGSSGTVKGTGGVGAGLQRRIDMSQGAFVTLVATWSRSEHFAPPEPKDGYDLRVGTTPSTRPRPRGSGATRSPRTSPSLLDRLPYVRASMHKGEPVLVRGKFKTRLRDKDGRPRTDTRINAEPSTRLAGHRQLISTSSTRCGRRPAGAPTSDQTREQMPGNPSCPGEPEGMIDEEAIERFGRDLDDADLARGSSRRPDAKRGRG